MSIGLIQSLPSSRRNHPSRNRTGPRVPSSGAMARLMMIAGTCRMRRVARQVATYSSPEAMGALDEDVRAPADLYSLGIRAV
jgi:hypothetical protein